MRHVCIFPTWLCQLSCSYCSIRNSQIDRSVQPVDWRLWARALPEVLDRGDLVNIAAAEPLMYPGLVDLLHALGAAGLRWAMTTNAIASHEIKRLCAEKPTGCACINVSDHRGNPQAHGNVLKLREAGYYVETHRLDHPEAGCHEPDARIISYQDWTGGRAVDGIARRCTAGLNHWVADPRGDLWRCVVALQVGRIAVGNLFTRQVRPTGLDCDFGCSSCYTENPASWHIEMREIPALCTSS